MLDLDIMLHKNKAAKLEAIAEDPYRNLIVAVFERAVKDLRSTDSDHRGDAYNRRLAKDAKEWIESRHFVEFCADFLGYNKGSVEDIRRALGL